MKPKIVSSKERVRSDRPKSSRIPLEELPAILARIQYKDWLTYQEVAALRGKSVQTIRNTMRPEVLPPGIRIRFNGHSPEINKADLLRAIDEGDFARPRKGRVGLRRGDEHGP